MSCSKLVVVAVFAGLCLMPPLSQAQTQTQERETALNLINDFIAKNCQRPTLRGVGTEIEVAAKVEAELNGLTRLVAGVGGEVGANARRVSWDGVDKSQVAVAMTSGNQCSVEMTALLLPVFFPKTPSEPDALVPEPNDTTRSDSTNLRYGVRKNEGKYLLWSLGLHATIDACRSKAQALECRELPQYLYCYYAAYPPDAPYPVCHWTAADCQAHYELRGGYATRNAIGEIRRVGCTQVLPRRALAEVDTYGHSPTSHGRLKPPRPL